MDMSEKLKTIAENEQKVYAAGMQKQYDEFWDAFQDYGKRTNYNRAFASGGWQNTVTFRPKYDIKPAECYMMFSGNWLNIDLVEYLDSLGVVFDTSNVYQYQYAFQGTYFTRLGVIDMQKATINHAMCEGCKYLHTIDKLIFSEKTVTHSQMFSNCTALKNITCEGVLADNLNLQWSTLLTKLSIESVFPCLSNTASGKTVTLSKTAVNNAFETGTGLADGSTSDEWNNLIATKSNWTIALV